MPEEPALPPRTANRNRIYRMIYQNRGISRPELCHRLGLSMPTVMQNVRQLQAAGLIEEAGSLDSTGGRKAVALACVQKARIAVGLDLTVHHVSGVAVDLEGNILVQLRERRVFTANGGYAAALGKMVEALLEQSGFSSERVLGVGISMPGTFSEDGSLMLDSRLLRMQNLRTIELSRAIPLPCQFCNDANAAGFAEVWDVQSPPDALYLSLSNTVGGAILLGGRLYMGENQRGGEFGHITVQRDGRQCYCGKRGCLDAYCSAERLSAPYGGELPAFFRSGLFEAGHIRHIHIGDYAGGYKKWNRLYPIPHPGEGTVDFPAFFRGLREKRYDGAMTLESPCILPDRVDTDTINRDLRWLRQQRDTPPDGK